MKKKSIIFFLVSFIIMIVTVIGIMLFYALKMAKNSEDAINDLGTLYMKNINNEITSHFETTIELRLNQVESMAKRNPPANSGLTHKELLKELESEGRMHDFISLAILGRDGKIQMIYGDPITIEESRAFLDALNNDENKVAVAKKPEGGSSIVLGVSTSYQMSDGKNGTALIAGISLQEMEKILSVKKKNTITYSSVVKKNGDFIVKNYHEEKGNYFERMRGLFEDVKEEDGEGYIARIQNAMSEGEGFSTLLPLSGERRHLYCSPLANSAWYIVTAMPYGEIDSIVTELGDTRMWLLLLSIFLFLVIYIVVLIMYYRMTSRYVAEAERAKKEADKANRAKSEFLSNMSHDIRTPMNAISAMTELALSNIDNKPAAQNYLRKIEISNENLLRLINDILDMSKIESGKMEMNMERVSLCEISGDITAIIQQQVKLREQVFEVLVYDIMSEYVYCDSVRLNQLIMNLLSNSVKFTKENGKIEFTLYQEPSPADDGYIRTHIIVGDNGIGMSEEFKRSIFTPFAREDRKRIQKTEGTGLGMAICKHIVDAMGGTIDVQSEQGKGTEFHVVLDMKKAADGRKEEMTLPAWKMIVVDDNEILCKTVVATLSEMGATAEYFTDGDKATAKIMEQQENGSGYDIVLMDYNLGDKNGVDVSEKIRDAGGTADIVLISSHDLSDDLQRVDKAGIKGAISKPLFKSILYDGLKRIMEGEGVVNAKYKVKKNFAGMRLLVAEDNDLNWEIASELLGQEGFEVFHAEDGKMCVDMFERSPERYYDAILMDLRMPVMNGYEATEAVRNLARGDSDVPIIAMTADAFVEDIKKCLACGMNAHISKPIEISKVTAQLEKEFKKQKLQ